MSFDKNKVSLVQLAEQYGVTLDPSGDDFVGLCPFHPDNSTKSFRVYEGSNTFYCFGCHAAGTIFDFIMKYDGISFKDAVEKLGAGCVDEFDLSDIEVKSSQRFNVHREMIETASSNTLNALYFQSIMMKTDKLAVKQLVEALWRWYDDVQVKFDTKITQGVAEGVLIQKLNDFYVAFNLKIKELQEKLSVVK